jgi:cytochrome c oxidase assembly protein subunit 11
MLGKLAVIAALMFGFGYALVPVYRAICDSLGINVLSISERRASQWANDALSANTQVDASRTISVEFDANARGPWEFKPEQRSIDVHPGELATVMYEFRNVQPRAMVAQAIPSYARQAEPYFNKLECCALPSRGCAPGESGAGRWPS